MTVDNFCSKKVHLYAVNIGATDDESACELYFDAESPFHALCITWSYYPDRQITYVGRGLKARCFCDTPASHADVWGYIPPMGKDWEVLYHRYNSNNCDFNRLLEGRDESGGGSDGQ